MFPRLLKRMYQSREAGNQLCIPPCKRKERCNRTVCLNAALRATVGVSGVRLEPELECVMMGSQIPNFAVPMCHVHWPLIAVIAVYGVIRPIVEVYSSPLQYHVVSVACADPKGIVAA